MSLSPDELNKRASANPARGASQSQPNQDLTSKVNSAAPVALDSARFLKRISVLEKETEELRRKIAAQARKFRDIIYKLEAEGDVRWCEECDTVHAIDENCQCSDDDSCLTDSERNR
jgi:hypothetical protein